MVRKKFPRIHIGDVFGRLTVTDKAEKKTARTAWKCVCVCGKEKTIFDHCLKAGTTQSCGCLSIDTLIGRTKDTCKAGHDISEFGRNVSGQCRVCIKSYTILYNYGITIEEYKALFDFQQGKCAICGKPLRLMAASAKTKEAFGRAEVDHVHYLKKDAKKINKKDTVRGILCGGRYAGCNSKLGHVDNVEWLTAAARYITNPPAKQLFKKEGHDDIK